MELMILSQEFHKRVVELLCSSDPRTRFRFSRTCRYFWDLTEKCPVAQPGYDIAIFNGSARGLLIQGRGDDKAEIPFRLSGPTFDEIPEAAHLPKNSRLWLNGSNSDPIPLLATFKAPSGKYRSVELKVRNLSPELVRFMNNHVERVGWTGDPESMSTLRCQKFRFLLPEQHQEMFVLLVETLIEEWRAGLRQLSDGAIFGAPTGSEINFGREHFREDGMMLKVTYAGSGCYLLNAYATF